MQLMHRIALLLLLAPAAVLARPSPLAGQWMCASTPQQLPALLQIPAGQLRQQAALRATADGHWHSNTLLTLVPTDGSAPTHLRLQLGGNSQLRGRQWQQQVLQAQLLPAAVPDRSLPAAAQRQFEALVLSLLRDAHVRHYRLLPSGPDQLLLAPIPDNRHHPRLACQRMPESPT